MAYFHPKYLSLNYKNHNLYKVTKLLEMSLYLKINTVGFFNIILKKYGLFNGNWNTEEVKYLRHVANGIHNPTFVYFVWVVYTLVHEANNFSAKMDTSNWICSNLYVCGRKLFSLKTGLMPPLHAWSQNRISHRQVVRQICINYTKS